MKTNYTRTDLKSVPICVSPLFSIPGFSQPVYNFKNSTSISPGQSRNKFYLVFTFLTIMLSGLIVHPAIGQPGKDGTGIVVSSGVIFNRYDNLLVSAPSASTEIFVSNINNLDGSAIAGASNNPYATNALAVGDLIMIIKMQGASINTTNSASYGAITSYNETGKFEVHQIFSVSSNRIGLAAGLTNSYNISATERVQVVRIPRFSSLTINAGAEITALPWGSSYIGGIVAIEVNGNAVINGVINTTGKGFRGGQLDNIADVVGNPDYIALSNFKGAEKGEGIAGYQSDYDALGGRYNRGAPANGGGGGNAHNTGGGGGANAGDIAAWTGMGVPDISTSSWIAAWNLESPGFATSSSSGGGRGGYSWSKNNRDALTLAPGAALWGGDDRQNRGGLGGRPLTYTFNTLFMGGGGGAGDVNQASGSGGGNGGGIAYLLVTGTVSGTGSIQSNGNSAGNSNNIHTDALGGGGGGGAIFLNVQGTITGISLLANGGNGGNQLAGTGNEAEGPGGGGGCGYIGLSGTPVVPISAAGGVYGTTASTGLTEFLPDGATGARSGSSVVIIYTNPPTSGAVLSSHLLFDARLENTRKVLIKWSVSNENAIVYEVEKSIDNFNWRTSFNIAAANANQINYYSTYDELSDGATYYYRLKITEQTGVVIYSKTIKIKTSPAIDITVNANTVTLYNLPASAKNLKLFSINGQCMYAQPVTSAIEQRIPIENLQKGIYLVFVDCGTTNKTIKIIK